MNKHCYRVVFNRQRNQMVVVDELASAHENKTKKSSKVLIQICLLISLTTSTLAYASTIEVDTKALSNHQPQIHQVNNRTLINIRPPNQDSTSHNVYHTFDVDRHGVVLNNSTSYCQSKLIGSMGANPNFKGQAASLIVNEVNSSNPSYIKGVVEVAGKQAHVVVANPCGIYVKDLPEKSINFYNYAHKR